MRILKTFIVAEDERGIIVRLIDFAKKHKFRSALYIKSKRNAIRANHYHKHDIHYTCLISGRFKYSEKGLSDRTRISSKIINPGEIVISYPKTIHAMEFLEDSELVVFTTESRSQAKYERDTVRIKLV